MSGLKRVTGGGGSDVKVYNVAGGKSLPAWLSEKKRAALRKDEEFRRRVELIQVRRRQAAPVASPLLTLARPQELDFPVSSSRVKLSADGNFLVVTGIHPPMARSPAASSSARRAGSRLLPAPGESVRALSAGPQV